MALQTMTISATSFKGVRDGGEVTKTDAARFGNSVNGRWKGTIVFTPSEENLAILRKSRITQIHLDTKVAKLGGLYTKKIYFGKDSSGNYVAFSFSSAYNTTKSKTIWTGNTLDGTTDSLGYWFLNCLMTDTKISVLVWADKQTVPDDSDYAKNYGGLTSPTTLTITYELLGSELTISDNQNFTLGENYTVPFVRHDSTFREEISLTYLDENGEQQTYDIGKLDENVTSSISINLPLSLANYITSSTTRAATLIVTTYETTETETREIDQNSYPINLAIPSKMQFSFIAPDEESGPSILSKSPSPISEKYFIQSFSQAIIKAGFSPYAEEPFTDTATLKEYKIYINNILTFEGNFGGQTSFVFTSNIFNDSGDKKIEVKIIDSRQKETLFHLGTIKVQKYFTPQIKSPTAQRMKNNKEASEEGTNALWSADELSCAEVTYADNQINVPVTLTLSWDKNENEKESKTFSDFSEPFYIEEKIENETVTYFKPDSFYTIEATLTDSLGQKNSTPVKALLTSTKYLIHFGQDGTGLGFGSSAKNANGITCGYKMFFYSTNHALSIEEGGTGVTNKVELTKIIGDLMYPVGSIYMSASANDPANIFGGVWEPWGAGRVPIGVGIGNDGITEQEFTLNSTGGEYKHLLTEEEMPNHKHYPADYNTTSTRADDNGVTKTYNRAFLTGYSPGAGNVRRGQISTGGSGEYTLLTETWNDIDTTYETLSTGGSMSHSIMQPYITCHMWKRIA